jgi:hypothetical protein
MFMVSRNLADPRRQSPGQHNLDRSISSYLEKCTETDPPSLPQQALPNTTIQLIALTFLATQSRRLHVIADLVVLAYFFLLRVGEYTPSSKPKRTIPLTETDVKLWQGLVEISHDAPLADLLAADGVTICLQNQKNGNKLASLHHSSSGNAILDPVKSAARLVHSARACAKGASLGTFHDDQGRPRSVSAAEIRSTIRQGAALDNLEAYGYDLKRIGSHSLRSGGAMRLKLAGKDDDVIKKMGRWSGNTYLRYIQTQIGELTADLATAMAQTLRFHHVG